MEPSSGTIATAPDEQTERDARTMVLATLSHYERTGKWITSNQMAQRDSWRGVEARQAARALLVDEQYINVDSDAVVRVTTKGREWVEAPSVAPQEKPAWPELAPVESSDMVELILYIENFQQRRGFWPTPTHTSDCGVRRRIGTERWHAALERLVAEGFLVRIMLRDHTQRFVRLVPVRWCPWLEGADGMMFWWDPSRGPIEPEDD